MLCLSNGGVALVRRQPNACKCFLLCLLLLWLLLLYQLDPGINKGTRNKMDFNFCGNTTRFFVFSACGTITRSSSRCTLFFSGKVKYCKGSLSTKVELCPLGTPIIEIAIVQRDHAHHVTLDDVSIIAILLLQEWGTDSLRFLLIYSFLKFRYNVTLVY